MTLVKTGLPNGGRTQFFDIDYDDTLPATHGLQVAQQLMTAADGDYTQLVGWFRGATAMPQQRLPVHIDTSSTGASWWGWGPIYNIYLGFGDLVQGESLLTRARFLLLSEVSEIFMRQRQFVPNYWFSAVNEGNKGEALSCFLANELLSVIGTRKVPSGFAKVSQWLGSARANFLDLNNDHITDPGGATFVENGCDTTFLNYLKYQRGFATEDIIANGAETLGGVFENLGLGPRTDAFPTFVGLVNLHYAMDPRLSTTPILENAFPVPDLLSVAATTMVTWVNVGLNPSFSVHLTRETPMDILVTLSTNHPELIDLPADVIIRAGQSSITRPLTVKKQKSGFTSENVTITADYAGMSVSTDLQLFAPSHWPMPPLQIRPDVPADLCGRILVEGTAQRFTVDNLSSFPTRTGLQVVWTAQNATGARQSDGSFVIAALPVAGTAVKVSATATNSAGITSKGDFDFAVQPVLTGFAADMAELLCRIRHIVDIAQRFPRIPIWGEEIWAGEVLEEIQTHAKELEKQTSHLAKIAKKAILAKSNAK